jgi:transcriptional regulator with XRE-family HTH domain
MTAPEVEKFLQELDDWCSAERGRQALIAREVGVSEGLVHDWRKGRRVPSLDQYFAIQAFLKRKHRREQRKRS